MMLPFKPIVSRDSTGSPTGIDSQHCYDYTPSCTNARVWWTAGLGTDTIVSINLDGTSPSVPWTLPGKLTADPSALRIGDRYLVAFTIGALDGSRNGIGWMWQSMTGNTVSNGVLIPQATDPLEYGLGQPSLAALPSGRVIMFARAPGNYMRAWILTVLSGRAPEVEHELTFGSPEDGVSPDIVFHAGRVWCLLTGGGLMGLRSYDYDSGRRLLRRERELELVWPNADGGTMEARCVRAAPLSVDGACMRKDANNALLLKNNVFQTWRGHGSIADGPGGWSLRALAMRMCV